jgi:hypothetical protein
MFANQLAGLASCIIRPIWVFSTGHWPRRCACCQPTLATLQHSSGHDEPRRTPTVKVETAFHLLPTTRLSARQCKDRVFPYFFSSSSCLSFVGHHVQFVFNICFRLFAVDHDPFGDVVQIIGHFDRRVGIGRFPRVLHHSRIIPQIATDP